MNDYVYTRRPIFWYVILGLGLTLLIGNQSDYFLRIFNSIIEIEFDPSKDLYFWIMVVLGSSLAFLGTVSVEFRFSRDEKELKQTRKILFIIPVTKRTIPFQKIKAIDIGHQYDDMEVSLNYDRHKSSTFSVDLILHDREIIQVATSSGREGVVPIAESISNVTGKRLT